jgi:hypothetical protein
MIPEKDSPLFYVILNPSAVMLSPSAFLLRTGSAKHLAPIVAPVVTLNPSAVILSIAKDLNSHRSGQAP